MNCRPARRARPCRPSSIRRAISSPPTTGRSRPDRRGERRQLRLRARAGRRRGRDRDHRRHPLQPGEARASADCALSSKTCAIRASGAWPGRVLDAELTIVARFISSMCSRCCSANGRSWDRHVTASRYQRPIFVSVDMAVERLVWQDVSGSRAPFALTGFAPIFSPLSSVSAMIEANGTGKPQNHSARRRAYDFPLDPKEETWRPTSQRAASGLTRL